MSSLLVRCKPRYTLGSCGVALAAILWLPAVFASDKSGNEPPSAEVELYGAGFTLSNNYGDGYQAGANIRLFPSPSTTVLFQASNSRAFHDHAGYFNFGLSQDLSNDLYVVLNAGGSDRASILPALRANGLLNWRVTDVPGLVVGAGVDYYTIRSTGDVRSEGVIAQVLYYVPHTPVILQIDGGMSRNYPGSHTGHRYGGAVTIGNPDLLSLTLRADDARVAYEAVGPDVAIADFHSQHYLSKARYWMTPYFGLQVSGDFVRNRFYHRNEGRLGFLFRF